MKKVFIFGAGASQGSRTHLDFPEQKAPLIYELFDSNYVQYADEVGLTRTDLTKYREEAKKIIKQ